MSLVLDDDDLSDATTLPFHREEPIEVGRLFDGRFPLERELGRGGMGVVFATHVASYPRPLAIKIVGLPANIFLESHKGGERVKLLDFGLAKHLSDDVRLTATGALLGSPAFMAPEQIDRPRDVDHRADLWSYCVVLYRLLTGVAPFAGAGGRLLAAIQCAPHRLATAIDRKLSGDLDAFFERGLAKDPNERYQTASTVHAALLYALD